MRQNFPNLLIYFFLLVFILQIIGLIALFLLPQPGQAQEIYDLGEIRVTAQSSVSTAAIGEYVKYLYRYSIGFVGILAAVVLMFGGVSWIMAGGSAERAANAKAWIGSALAGLVLALSSYLILNIVNADLVNFNITTLTKVGQMRYCCSEKKGSFIGFAKETDNKQSYSCTPRTIEELEQYGTVYECSQDEPCALAGDKYQCTNSLLDPTCLSQGGNVIGVVNKNDPDALVQCNISCPDGIHLNSFWFNNNFFYCCICISAQVSGYCQDTTGSCYPMSMTRQECCTDLGGQAFCANPGCAGGCTNCP